MKLNSFIRVSLLMQTSVYFFITVFTNLSTKKKILLREKNLIHFYGDAHITRNLTLIKNHWYFIKGILKVTILLSYKIFPVENKNTPSTCKYWNVLGLLSIKYWVLMLLLWCTTYWQEGLMAISISRQYLSYS